MSGTKLQPVRGTHDIFPEENAQRRLVLEMMRYVAERYGYGEISTPMFEFTEVFQRTLGDTSDVVTKETYSFTDRGGENLTLRPEFTASVVRAFISESLQDKLPLKYFYHGPAFRYERPQKGRLRQFHQIGVELLGVAEPSGDVEVIALAWHLLAALGLAEKVTLEINSLGDAASRRQYRAALVEYYQSHRANLSEDSQRRLEKNPLRILDSKDEGDRRINAGAPSLEGFFTPEAAAFFAQVQLSLSQLGIPFTINSRLVRGLDYYSHTVFEFTSSELGAQNTVLAGGRYDGLVAMMGGPETPGIGWAAGIERLLALIDFAPFAHTIAPLRPVAILPMGDEAEKACLVLAEQLRRAGYYAELLLKGNLGKRMTRANKYRASVALIVGDTEIQENTVGLRDLDSGEQRSIALASLMEALVPYRNKTAQ